MIYDLLYPFEYILMVLFSFPTAQLMKPSLLKISFHGEHCKAHMRGGLFQYGSCFNIQNDSVDILFYLITSTL